MTTSIRAFRPAIATDSIPVPRKLDYVSSEDAASCTGTREDELRNVHLDIGRYKLQYIGQSAVLDT